MVDGQPAWLLGTLHWLDELRPAVQLDNQLYLLASETRNSWAHIATTWATIHIQRVKIWMSYFEQMSY